MLLSQDICYGIIYPQEIREDLANQSLAGDAPMTTTRISTLNEALLRGFHEPYWLHQKIIYRILI